MKRRTVGILLIVLALMMAWALPAGAIAGGEKSDDTRVGALFLTLEFPDGSVDGPFFVCSGFQVEATVFVTAGHCLAWTGDLPPGTQTHWAVTFADHGYDIETGGPTGPLLAATGGAWDPGFGHDRSNLKDYAVVLFEGDDTLPGPYIDLPYLGQLDDMKAAGALKGLVFDRVGYGSHPEFKQGPPTMWWDGYRYEAETPFKALNQNWLRIHENIDATGLGGGCYGDSGSPILVENTAFALTSGGDPLCRSDSWNQRLDTQEAQDFLDDYLDL